MRVWIRNHPYWALLVITVFVHSTLFFGVFGMGYAERFMTDGSQYQTIADNLLAGHGFSLRHEPPFVPDTIRTPGYPYVLAAVKNVTGSYTPTLILTLLLGCFLPVIGARMTSWFIADRRVWLLVGSMLALDPNLFYYSFVFGSEGMFLPLVASGMLLAGEAFLRRSWRWGVFAGGVIGLAALVRPIVQFVPILFFLATVITGWKGFRRHALRTASAFIVAYFVVVSPWLARNLLLFGTLDYANVGWFNLYTRVAASAEAIHRGIPYDSMRIEYLQRLHQKGYVATSPVEEQDVHGYEFTPIFRQETLVAVKRFPVEVLITQVGAFSTVVGQDLTIVFARNLGWVDAYPSFSPFVTLARDGFIQLVRETMRLVEGPWAIALFLRAVWLSFFFVSLLAPLVAWRFRRDRLGLACFLLLYNLGIIALSLNAAAQADARYRAQYQFVQIPLAAFVLFEWRKGRRERRTQKPEGLSCPACGSRSFLKPFGERCSYPLWKCGFCRTVSVLPRPTLEVLEAFYGESYFGGGEGSYMDYEADKRATRPTLERYLDLLQEHGVRGRLLDVGAATGTFLEYAKERGWSVSAHDFSEAAAAKLREKGIEVSTRPLAEAFPGKTFEAVSLLDVIEHVLDPAQTLQNVKELLVPRGVLLVNTPDAGSWVGRLLGRFWHAIVPPEHLTLFTAASLERLLESKGWEVLWVGRLPKRFRMSYVLSTFARWVGWTWMGRLARSVEGHPRLNVSFRWPLNDNITIVAQRR